MCNQQHRTAAILGSTNNSDRERERRDNKIVGKLSKRIRHGWFAVLSFLLQINKFYDLEQNILGLIREGRRKSSSSKQFAVCASVCLYVCPKVTLVQKYSVWKKQHTVGDTANSDTAMYPHENNYLSSQDENDAQTVCLFSANQAQVQVQVRT